MQTFIEQNHSLTSDTSKIQFPYNTTFVNKVKVWFKNNQLIICLFQAQLLFYTFQVWYADSSTIAYQQLSQIYVYK